MAELATLGIEAKTTGLDQATSKLDQLSGAAKRAEAAVEGIGPSSSKAGQMASQAANATATALRAEATAADKAAASMRAHAVAANQNVPGLTKMHNVSNFAAQGFDIVTTAAGGMNAALIGMQQGLQVAQGLMGVERPLRTLGAAFLAMLSPVTLLAVGLTALLAAGLQMVPWATLAASALTGLANALDTIAPYAIAAAAALALIYGPAIVGGILGVTAYLAGLATAATMAAAQFAVAWYAAAAPLTLTLTALAAVGAAVYVLRDEIKSAFGIDVLQVFKVAGNTMISVFVGAVNGIKASFAVLPAALGSLMVQTANAVIKAVEAMVNGVSELLNGFIEGINGMLSKLPSFAGGGVQLGTIGKVSFGGMNDPWAGAAGQVGSSINDAINQASKTDWIGNIGSSIGEGADYASGKLKELSKWITTVDDKAKKKGGGGKTEGEKYSDIVDGANRRIASLKAEEQAIGMTEEASARLRYETDLFNQVQQKGLELTPARRAELQGLAAQMAAVEVATKHAKEVQEAWNEAGQGFGGILKGLTEGTMTWKDALLQAIPVVLKLLNSMNLAQGGKGILGGGFFQNLIGGFLGVGFASGGYTGNGATHQAAGIVHRGEYVFSKAATARIGVANLDRAHKAAKGYASGGYVTPAMPVAAPANNNIMIEGSQIIVQGNADKRTLAEMQKMLDQRDRQITKNIGKTIDDRNKVSQSRKTRA
jgi:hypothetical protein